METTRSRSSYLMLNLAWFIGLCALCFVAGMATQAWQDGRSDSAQCVCGFCMEPITDDFVAHHRACLEKATKEQANDGFASNRGEKARQMQERDRLLLGR